jgi:hypothetical protein
MYNADNMEKRQFDARVETIGTIAKSDDVE